MIDAELDNEIATLLRRFDQRYTTGRRKVIAALRDGAGPLTITQILAADSSLSQSSVYRSLTVLEEVGAITRIVTGDDFSRYELAEHLTEHHHHLICTSCGDVFDFALDDRIESSLDSALHKAAEVAGFTPAAHRLDLFGSCVKCPVNN